MKISAVIITFNEEDRLPDALASLQGVADEIVVVDSYSTDRTAEIARQARATVCQNRFEDYGQQKNFAMQKAGHEWILNLDADERVSPELKQRHHGAEGRRSRRKTSPPLPSKEKPFIWGAGSAIRAGTPTARSGFSEKTPRPGRGESMKGCR